MINIPDQKEQDKSESIKSTEDKNLPESNTPANNALQKQLQQIAGGQPVLQNVAVSAAAAAAAAASNNNGNHPSKFQQCIADGDLEFVRHDLNLQSTGVSF